VINTLPNDSLAARYKAGGGGWCNESVVLVLYEPPPIPKAVFP